MPLVGKPKLSVLCITYNHEKFIKEALEGFLMQKTNFPFQVILGEDCSTDKTASIIQEYANKYPEIIKPVFQEQNIGALNNFIHTLSRIDTEYVAWCDGDDYWTDEFKLQKQVDFLEANQDCTMCFHNVSLVDEYSKKNNRLWPIYDNYCKFDMEDIAFEKIAIASGACVYRWIFRNGYIVGKFPENIINADTYLHILHAQNAKIGYINSTMSAYRIHQGGVWSDGIIDRIDTKYGVEMVNFYYAIYSQILGFSESYKKNILVPRYKRIILNLFKYGEFAKAQGLIAQHGELCKEVMSEVIELLKVRDEARHKVEKRVWRRLILRLVLPKLEAYLTKYR